MNQVLVVASQLYSQLVNLHRIDRLWETAHLDKMDVQGILPAALMHHHLPEDD
jgi:hypothetical protein